MLDDKKSPLMKAYSLEESRRGGSRRMKQTTRGTCTILTCRPGQLEQSTCRALFGNIRPIEACKYLFYFDLSCGRIEIDYRYLWCGGPPTS